MSQQTKKVRMSKNNAVANTGLNKGGQILPGKRFEDNRSENAKHKSIQRRVNASLTDLPKFEKSDRRYPAIEKPINPGAASVVQLGKYKDNEFIGSKTSPTHVHIYNQERGHVKVNGVVYKYGYSNSEEQNMREAKAALQDLNEDDVSQYDKILSFINAILDQY